MPEYTVITEQVGMIRRTYKVSALQPGDLAGLLPDGKPLGHTFVANDLEVVVQAHDEHAVPVLIVAAEVA